MNEQTGIEHQKPQDAKSVDPRPGRPPGRERGLAARNAAIAALADLLAPGAPEREGAALAAKWLESYVRRSRCAQPLRYAPSGGPDELCAAIIAASAKPLPGAPHLRRIIRENRRDAPFFCTKKRAQTSQQFDEEDDMGIMEILPKSRAALVKQRLEILAAQGEENQLYWTALEAAKARLKAAEEAACWPRNPYPSPAMSEANAALIRLVDAHTEKAGSLQRQLAPIETKLRAGTAEAVDNFMSEVIADMDNSRRKFTTLRSDPVIHPLTGHKSGKSWTNAVEVQARVTALFAARDYADSELRYIENTRDLAAEFAKLRAALPMIPVAAKESADEADVA
jgi:hypothetical protein